MGTASQQQQMNRSYPFRVFWWTVSFLKPYRWLLALYILLGLLVTLGEMSVPKAIAVFIDDVQTKGDVSLLWTILLVLSLIVLITMGMKAGNNLLERIISEKAARDMQFTIFQKLRQLGFPYFEQHAVGESLSLMNTEVTAVQLLYKEHFPDLLQKIILVMIIQILLATMYWPLAVSILPWFVLYWFVGPFMEKRTMHAALKTAEHRIRVNKKLYDSLSALTELRAHGREEWNRADIHRVLHRYLYYWSWDHIYSWVRGVPRRLVVYSATAFVFFYGALLVRDGLLTVGEFVAFALYFLIMIFPLTVVVTNLTEIRLLMAQAGRLYQLMNQVPLVKEANQPRVLDSIKGRLSFDRVTFAYGNREPAIRDLTLDIRPGEKVAFVGESGSGKSTLLKLVSRFYDPAQGRIRLDGVPLTDLSLASLREAVGTVFQETYLFGTSIKENIRFGRPEASEDEIIEAARAAFAHEFISRLPCGYDTAVGERGYKLSGGQKQRLAIARLILNDPAIVVLDEATSALDNVSERQVQRAIDQLLQGRTTLTVAHRLSSIRHYDRIVVLAQGRMVEMGTYEELLEKKGTFYQLVHGGRSAYG